MPKIPTIQRQVSLPGQSLSVQGNVASAGAIAEGISNTAENLADVVARQQESIRRRDNANKLLIVGAAYDDEQRSFEGQETSFKGQDTYDNITRGTKFREDSIAKYTKDINDPDLKSAVMQHIHARSGSMLNKLAAYQQNQREEVTKTALDNMTQGVLKDAYEGEDLNESLDRARVAIKVQQASGAYGEEGAVEILMKSEKQIAEAHLDGLINRDPVAAIDAIKSGKYDNFLDQKSMEKYDTKAKQLQKALQADAEHAAVEAKRLEKEQRELAADNANKDLTDLEVNGRLTRAQIVKYRNTLSDTDYRAWNARISKRNESAAGGGDGFKTNKTVQMKLFRNLLADPESISEADIVNKIGNGLSYSAAKELINEKRRRERGEVDPVRAAGERSVIESLKRARKDGLLGEGREGEQEYIKQTEALKKWLQANPKEDPSEYYDKVMEPVKVKGVRRLLDNVLGPLYDPEKPNPKQRREELTGTGTQSKAVDINQWLAAAKKANPKASEKELRQYYANKYGKR